MDKLLADKSFYHAFETKHRGSRELIKERLKVYLPFLEPFKTIYDDLSVLDLGCGRGEWLELMQEHGFNPFGVDLDEGMLSECRERNLNVSSWDALSYIKNAPPESYVAVTAFHLIEHLPIGRMQDLIARALMVLKPGGLLILETPNPENIRVATTSFYLDPTHVRPVPPLLLEFLADYYGFVRVKVLRLQESPHLFQDNRMLGLIDVLSSVSPDYAIVAQKAADSQIMGQFDEVFNRNYGVSLEDIAMSFDKGINARLNRLDDLGAQIAAVNTKLLEMTSALHAAEARAERAEEEAVLSRERAERAEEEARVSLERALSAEGRAASAESLARSLESAVNTKLLEMTSRLQFLENKLADMTKSTIENQDQYEAKLAELHAQINALYNSISWRITKPLRTPPVRFLYRQVVRIREQGLMGRIKFVGGNLAKMAALKGIHYIEAHPGLYDTALKWIHRLGLYGRARAFYRKMKHGEGVGAISSYASMNAAQLSNIPVEITHLSPRARRIYLQLKEAIERRNKGL